MYTSGLCFISRVWEGTVSKILGRRRGLSHCLDAALKILHLSLPSSSQWLTDSQQSIKGWEKIHLGPVFTGWRWAGNLPWTVESLMWWSRAEGWYHGRGTGTGLWGFLIMRNGGQSASRVMWLLGTLGLRWESKGTQKAEESIKHQHLPPSVQTDFCRADGEVRFLHLILSPSWLLVLGHTGEWCSSWSGQP